MICKAAMCTLYSMSVIMSICIVQKWPKKIQKPQIDFWGKWFENNGPCFRENEVEIKKKWPKTAF